MISFWESFKKCLMGFLSRWKFKNVQTRGFSTNTQNINSFGPEIMQLWVLHKICKLKRSSLHSKWTSFTLHSRNEFGSLWFALTSEIVFSFWLSQKFCFDLYKYKLCRLNSSTVRFVTADPPFLGFLWITRFLWKKNGKRVHHS